MGKQALLKKLLERSKGKKITVLDRVLFAILFAGLILMIVFFVYLLWFTLSNRSINYMLPADKTVAYFELEDLALPPTLNQDTIFDLLGLSVVIEKVFNLNANELQDHVAQGRLGVSLVKGENEESELLLFFRVRNQKRALQFFENLTLENEQLVIHGKKENTIYSYPQSQPFVFSFVGPYLLIAEEIEAIELVQDVHKGKIKSLNEDEIYQKSLSNLPRQTWGRGYLNAQTLNFDEKNPLKIIADSLKPLASHFALTIRKEHNGFHVNTLLSLNPDLLALKKSYTDSTRFAYSLADYIGSKNLALYIGGANLAGEWQNTLKSISELNPAYGIILEGIVRAQVNRIFGEDISLRNDIYPLFEGEYALTFENLENDQLGIKLILKHDDRQFAETKLLKLLDGFETLASQFAPKLKVFELPDGTESRELVADPTRMKEIDEMYEDYNLNCLDVTDSAYGFCYTVTDELIVMANHPDSIKEVIDLSVSPRFTLSHSQPFRQSLSNLSAISDEISFMDLENFNEILKNTKAAPVTGSFVNSFEALTWIKHYFDDGVSTEGYLLLK